MPNPQRAHIRLDYDEDAGHYRIFVNGQDLSQQVAADDGVVIRLEEVEHGTADALVTLKFVEPIVEANIPDAALAALRTAEVPA